MHKYKEETIISAKADFIKKERGVSAKEIMTVRETENKNTIKRIIQKPEEGVTVAIVTGYMDPAYEINCSTKSKYVGVAKLLDSCRPVPEERLPIMKGIARCAEIETYDPEFGESLACARAEALYHHRMAQIYKQNISDLKDAIAQFEKLEIRHRDKEAGLRKHIANMCGETQGDAPVGLSRTFV